MASPTRRGSRWVPPKPGMIPRLISGWPKLADSAARRKSHAIASSQPPPKAIEFTAAMVTVRDCSIPRMNAWAESISSLPSLSGDILVNSLMSAPALNVNTFEDANTTTRSLPSISLPQLGELLHDLRGDRVGGRAVEPHDAHVAAGLERDRLARLALVGLRVGEEALAALLAQPALRHQALEHRGRLEAVAPLALRALQRLEHGVQALVVGAGERAGQDARAHHHPDLDVLGGGLALLEHQAGLDQGLQPHPLDDASPLPQPCS